MSLILPNYPDVENTSPFETDESIVTVEASGGSVPYSYAITSQSTTAGMLKVTGTFSPDATGVYVENGTHNGKPYYQRGSDSWYIFFDAVMWRWMIAEALSDDPYYCWYTSSGTPVGDYTPLRYSGTATVANYEPFTINASTGEITITDPSGLAVGQTWTLTVQATDASLDTDLGTVTITLIEAGTDPNIGRKFALPIFLR